MALLLARLDDIYAGQRRLSNAMKRPVTATKGQFVCIL